MPVESPETKDPDAFFEGESFLVQEAEDVMGASMVEPSVARARV